MDFACFSEADSPVSVEASIVDRKMVLCIFRFRVSWKIVEIDSFVVEVFRAGVSWTLVYCPSAPFLVVLTWEMSFHLSTVVYVTTVVWTSGPV